MDLKSKIRVVEDFPKAGISFKDITTLLQDGKAYKEAVMRCVELLGDKEYDLIVGPEARGFLLGAPMSVLTEKGFVPVRKPGKLPYETVCHEYELEYGVDKLEVHKDAITPGSRVLIVDDLLATGGTAKAVCDLVEHLGGEVVGLAFLIELEFLGGREMLSAYDVYSVIPFES